MCIAISGQDMISGGIIVVMKLDGHIMKLDEVR